MDSLPGQIRFEFTLSTEKRPDPGLVKTRNFKVLADVEGHLFVLANDQVVFDENGVLLLELGVDLLEWLRDVSHGNVRDFDYVSMDFAEGPILRFIQTASHHWTLRSPWMKGTGDEIIERTQLLAGVNIFLSNLQEELRSCYGIEIAEFSNQSSP